MRPKVVIPVLLFTAVILALVFRTHPRSPASAEPPPAVTTAATTAARQMPASVPAKPEPVPMVPAAAPADPALAFTNHDDYVGTRIAELMDLAMKDDAASLQTILSELSNADPQIRVAAVAAAVQFKSPDAIPALQTAYDAAVEPEEKLQIRDAIEFLKLPSAGDSQNQTN